MRHPRDWTITEARAEFDELIDEALAGRRQIITRNGRKVAVVVAINARASGTKRAGNLAEFFAASPLKGSGLRLRRLRQSARSIDL